MFVNSSKKAEKSLTYSSIVCIILYLTDMPKGILSFSSLVYTISKIIINRSIINIFVSYCLTFLWVRFLAVRCWVKGMSSFNFNIGKLLSKCTEAMYISNCSGWKSSFSHIPVSSRHYHLLIFINLRVINDTLICNFSDCESSREYFHIGWYRFISFITL